MLHISVKDTGIGLPENETENVFKPFVQAAADASAQGTGLGLSITKNYIELLGGSVRLSSKFGAGTEVFVEIPAAESDASGIKAMASEFKNITAVTDEFKNIKIMIAEDNKENRLLLTKILEKISISKVRIAENGLQAVQIYPEFMPDLIFMDIRMPKMDGLEAVKTIRNCSGSENCKIIAVSAHAFKEDLEKLSHFRI